MHEIGRGELRAPARVLDIDVARPYGDAVVDVKRYATAWCLVRRNGVVVAARFFDIETESSIALATLRDRLVGSGLPQPVEWTEGLDASLTVAIPTNRRTRLPTVLNSLAAQSDKGFDVLIVDNSGDGEIARTIPEFEGLVIRCCREPEQGISWARNCGLSSVTSELVAWIDDDEEADPDWIAWIKRGFATPGRPDAVVGVMLPAELETDAQVNFERYGGFNKGRPMQPVELRAGTPSVWDPLFPLPNFGAGGNMAFRTDALRAIGGFDTRLGCPSIFGGEETRALSQLLEQGSLILHWPPAVTWHYHRRTDAELEKQFFGYSAGLTAFYMSTILSSPKHVFRILGFIPRGVKRIQANRRAGHPNGPPAGFPDHLLRAGRRGLYRGAWLYLSEARRQRRAVK
jgi:GT2 family glycosyltransferase